jgi:hypothetical protein
LNYFGEQEVVLEALDVRCWRGPPPGLPKPVVPPSDAVRCVVHWCANLPLHHFAARRLVTQLRVFGPQPNYLGFWNVAPFFCYFEGCFFSLYIVSHDHDTGARAMQSQ